MRYVRAPAKAVQMDDYWEEPFRPSLTVSERDPVNTGLLWSDGSPIMRVNEPIGFGREGWGGD